jgi:hypothetical protein
MIRNNGNIISWKESEIEQKALSNEEWKLLGVKKLEQKK